MVFAQPAAPGRDMGWIAQADAVQSLRPVPKRRWPWSSLVFSGGLTILGVIGGLAGGYYLSAHTAQPVRAPLYALQISDAPHATLTPPLTPAPAPPAMPPPRPAPHPLLAAPVPPPPSAPPQIAQVAAPPAAKPIAHDKPEDTASLRRAETDRQVKDLAAACDHGPGCDASSVARADRLVSDAYAAALQSGASASSLADVQRRWNDLRREADEPPQILVGNYVLLAKELNHMTAAPPRSHPSDKGAGR
jgi:hypothetical protein